MKIKTTVPRAEKYSVRLSGVTSMSESRSHLKSSQAYLCHNSDSNQLLTRFLLGQPFDIVKVRLQTTTQYSSAINAATTIYKNEGALAFYKGTLTPLIGIGACVSVQFGAFNAAKRWFQDRNKGAELSYPQYGAAGAFAGISNSANSERTMVFLVASTGASVLLSGERHSLMAPGLLLSNG